MSNTVVAFNQSQNTRRKKKLISKVVEMRALAGVFAINVIPSGNSFNLSMLANLTTDNNKRWVIEGFESEDKHAMCELIKDAIQLHTRNHPDDLELSSDWEAHVREFQIGNQSAISLFHYDKA